MGTKTTGLFLAVFLLTISLIACAADNGSSGSGSGTSSRVGSGDLLKLIPEDVSRIQVVEAGEITGGSVPESMTEMLESTWKDYALGDDLVTIDDVDRVVWAISPEGGIVMMSGSQIDFAGISEWLADEETNIGKTSYQGEEMWGGESVAMVLMQSDGYLVFGETDAVKEVLKVKARGTGSLADDSENELKTAYEDATAGWYVSVSDNCDEFSSELRSCEAYSISGSAGKEDYLVNVTYRFIFRSEQRAESQALDIEDVLEDWDRAWDIDEVKADGVSVEAKLSGDEEDFIPQWLGVSNVFTPPPLPTATPEPESRGTTGTTTASTSGQPTAAPAATTAPAPTAAPAQEEALLKYEGPCTSSFQSEGTVRSEWTDNCLSYGSGLYYAYYYAFRINSPTTIIIELTSDVYTELLLLQGPVGAWYVLDWYASSNSGVIEFTAHHLPAGEYVIEVASDYLAGYELSAYLDGTYAAPTAAVPTEPPATATPQALRAVAAQYAGGPGAIYVGDISQLVGPAPDDDLGDWDGNVPLESLERHLWLYGSDYYESLIEKANLTDPTPLTTSGESIEIQHACVNRLLPPCKLLETYFAPRLSERTNGQVQFRITSYPELGLAGPDTLELFRDGTLSSATVYGSYLEQRIPTFGIQNLYGLYSSPEQEFEGSQAIIKDIEEMMQAETGGAIMNHSWYAGYDQFFFCRRPLQEPQDFEGIRFHSHSQTLSDWISGMGGAAQFFAFAEVYTALERGIVDCGIMGADAALAQRWYEVTDYISGPLPSFPFNANVINREVWNSIPADLQQIILEEAAKSELEALRLAAVQNEVGLRRNIDSGLEFVSFSPEMTAHSMDVAVNNVIPAWVNRVGDTGHPIIADTFNNKVGPIVGLRIEGDGTVARTR